MKRERFDSMTDAIIAIIITLMVLEIKIPEFTTQNIPDILLHIFVYALSFTTIAIGWLNHHHTFVHLKSVSPDIIWLNFGLLFCLSLVPLVTEPLSQYFFEPASHIAYATVLCAVSVFFTLLRRAAAAQSGSKAVPLLSLRNWLTVAVYFSAIPLALVSIYLSAAVFLSVNVFYFVQSRKSNTA